MLVLENMESANSQVSNKQGQRTHMRELGW